MSRDLRGTLSHLLAAHSKIGPDEVAQYHRDVQKCMAKDENACLSITLERKRYVQIPYSGWDLTCEVHSFEEEASCRLDVRLRSVAAHLGLLGKLPGKSMITGIPNVGKVEELGVQLQSWKASREFIDKVIKAEGTMTSDIATRCRLEQNH
eukprot:4008418-Amphidinium_carterae.2